MRRPGLRLADISIGSVGSPEGYSTVIVRSKKGEELLHGLQLARKGKTRGYRQAGQDQEGERGHQSAEGQTPLRPPFPFLNCSIEYSPFYPQKRAENQKLAAGKPILPGETGIAAQMDEPLHAPGANQILLHQSIRHMTSVEPGFTSLDCQAM